MLLRGASRARRLAGADDRPMAGGWARRTRWPGWYRANRRDAAPGTHWGVPARPCGSRSRRIDRCPPSYRGRAHSTSDAQVARWPLTPREREILRWLALGKTDRDIAALAAASVRTVHKHLQRIYEKLGVETGTAAVLRTLGTH